MSTFIKDKNNTNKIMKNLFIALLPIIIFSFYKNGISVYINGKTNIIGMFYPLIFLLIPALVTFLTETIYAKIVLKVDNLSKYIESSYSIFPGLFLGLICPINLPISILIIGALCASIFGKLIYGGFGHNIFNPALIGYIFIVISYSVFFSSNNYLNKMEVDTISSSTPLTNIKLLENIGSYEKIVTPFGNLSNFFIGFIPGSMGETSSLLCLVALLYLMITKTIKWKIPVIYIGTVFIMTSVIGLINNQGIYYPLVQIFSGGLMFGAIFMATDPVTSPTTNYGVLLSAIGLGILTVFLRYNSSYPEGVATSILIMNLFTFIFDKIGIKSKLNKNIFVFSLIILFIFSSAIIIRINDNYKVSDIDKNFSIISKDINGTTITYVASQKGYSSDIKAEIIFSDEKLISFKILEQNESFYSKVEAENYINKLINNSTDLDNLDTVSGATITSGALKRLAINVIKDYESDGYSLKKSNVKVEEKNDFEVLEKNDNTYIVSQKSFSGKMKAIVIVLNNRIINFEITELNDSYKDKVLGTSYIDDLIINQDNLDTVNTISGATITSRAIKNIFIEMEKLINE